MGITQLMVASLGMKPDAPELSPNLQAWKYWTRHPLTSLDLSYIFLRGETVVAHGCCWPIVVQGAFGELPAMQLIDWVAKPDAPGAGMRVLQLCQKDLAAVFSVGGTELTQKILPAIGFKLYNAISFLKRPLRPFHPAFTDSPHDWKMPARVLRNFFRYFKPAKLPADWTASLVAPSDVPEHMFPRSTGLDDAVSLRNPSLLAHIASCPILQGAGCYILSHQGEPKAYFFLALAGGRARLLDYGPAGLDEQTASALALAAQDAARRQFPGALEFLAATTEPRVRTGWTMAGLLHSGDEAIKVLKLHPALTPVSNFRLTLMDWDGIYL